MSEWQHGSWDRCYEVPCIGGDEPPRRQFPVPVEMFGEIRPALDEQWLIDGILPYEGDAIVFGPPGGGKTFVTLDMALHTAAKRWWMGRKVDGGGVVYLAAEGQAGIRKRIEAWKIAHGYIDKTLPFALVPVALDLLQPKTDIERLKGVVSELSMKDDWLGVRLVVIDTLAKTFGGGDENGSDMAAYISNISTALADYGCLRLIVHHQPWTSEVKRPRGHSSLLGAVDAAIHVAGDRDAPVRQAIVTKQKDGEDGTRILFKLRSVEIGRNSDGKPVTSCVVDPAGEDEMLPTRAGKKISPAEKIVLLALDRVTERSGITPPEGLSGLNPLRTGRVADLSGWASEAIAALHEPDKKPDSARTAFSRARKTLQGSEIIGIQGEYVWRNW